MTELTPSRLRMLLAGIEKAPGRNGCWLWSGAGNKDGYSCAFDKGEQVYRIVYEWMVGPIPDGYELDHLCRVPACVNPHHLEPVTHGENGRRARSAGPWMLRTYCKRGHALTGKNRRVWSEGPGRKQIVRCYACHDGSAIRHAS
jgi:hypothetical protein